MARGVEERKNIRRAVFFGVLSLGVLIAFLFLGLPLVARVASFVADFRKSGEPVNISDTTPPAPPRFESLPEVTKEEVLVLKGGTENGATVFVYANSDEKEILADAEGTFNFSFELRKGENKLSAKAKDASGNVGMETQTFVITQDDEPPDLTISAPSDGKEFFGSKERQITIEGETEEGASVTINDRVVVVDSEGQFVFSTTLSDGENIFKIKAKDKAENETETTLTLKFSS